MASIQIVRVGDNSDISALKVSFNRMLIEHLTHGGPAPTQPRTQTFLELIEKRGLTDKKVQANARRRAKYVPAGPMHAYPTIHEVQHRLTIEAQGPLVTYDGDGGFSSRGMTDWYVNLFCTSNHLKH
jgi:hypothetical protein